MKSPSVGRAAGADGIPDKLPAWARIEAVQRLFELGRGSKPLWWYPAWSLVGGLVLGLVMTSIVRDDYGSLSFLVYEGGPESARSFVSLAATSVATITSLTLTITVVTLQLASSQYSPRLIEHYLNDRGLRAVISLFLLTFAFAVATLLNVRLPGVGGGDGEVPGPAISLLVVLVIGCLGGLVFFVFRVTQSVRVESILERVRDRTLEAIERREHAGPDRGPPADGPDYGGDGRLVHARRTGFYVDLDRDAVANCESVEGARIWILVSPGDFVTQNMPVAAVVGWDDDDTADTIASWLRFDSERWIEADYSYGVRSLSDVAIKALSPGINDPTTAIMAINRIGEVLATSASVHPQRVIEFGTDGYVYVAVKSWSATLEEVLHQLALYGRDDVHVVTAVTRLLWSLAWLDLDDRRRDQIREAAKLYESLVDVERPDRDRAIIDRNFEHLHASLTGSPTATYGDDVGHPPDS